jgi:DNA-binding GntR family transcriptional regulator
MGQITLGTEVNSLTDQAVRLLRELLLSGRLAQGERLNEVELSAAMGISRGPLREAIRQLDAEGLLVRIPNRGAFVQSITSEVLTELYEVRIALEIHALRLIASNEAALEKVGQLLSTTRLRIGKRSPYPADLDFHRFMLPLAGNRVIERTAEVVLNRIQITRSAQGNDPRIASGLLKDHDEIYRFLVEGDVGAATDALERHLRSTLEAALVFVGGGSAS